MKGWTMGKTVVDVSPSADGYVAGPGVSVERPFGSAGHRLHRWLGFEGVPPSAEDQEAAKAMFATAGAVVLGRRMFELGIGVWGEDGTFGLPCYVVTSRPHADVVRGPTTFRFVTSGVRQAVELARDAAGDQDVVVVGGAQVIQECLAEGLVGEIRLHVVPVLLGDGTPLFGGSLPAAVELEQIRALSTSLATHLTFRVK
jgi:dihydrofolate reductase